MLLAACGAPPDSPVGSWRSVALEGGTLEAQGVTEMRFDFTLDSVAMTSRMEHEDGSEIDRRTMPYEIRGDTIRLGRTSTVSEGALRFRLSGDTLVLEVTEPPDARDVRIHLARIGS